MEDEHASYEKLNESLNDDANLADYKAPYDTYRPSFLARFLGGILIESGTLVYGDAPSYQKFRAIEVIARVPYHSWASAIFTLLTLFYSDEKQALRLSTLSGFTKFASDNETMHVIVISQLAKAHEPAGLVRHSIIPALFAVVYFWMSYLIYLVSPRWSLEINYLFEQHAFEQYSRFVEQYGEGLKRCLMQSEYLTWYGRTPRSEYEFFLSVRNDELIHRNRSIHEIALHTGRAV